MSTMTTTIGLAKVFILDKYFSELQKFWETEKRLQEATSSGEAANLQHRLRTLSSGLVGLRHTLQEEQAKESSTANYCNVDCSGSASLAQQQQPDTQSQSQNGISMDGFGTLHSVRSHVTEVSSVANVSDPASALSSNNNNSINNQLPPSSGGVCANGGTGAHTPPLSQLSPPRPVSTLQHNYSNIPQPAPLMPEQQPQPGAVAAAGARPMGPSSLPSAQGSSAGEATGPSIADSAASGGAFSRSAVRPRTPTRVATDSIEELRMRSSKEHLQKTSTEDLHQMRSRTSRLTELHDLIHLDPPLSEDAILRTMQARFFNQKYFTNIGPIVLSVNPYRDVGNPLTLSSTRHCPRSPELAKVVSEVLRLQGESGYPQAIIISGASGSGKTHTSMVVLRQLFEAAGGAGTETDTFKHLSAAFTVLRSLGTAKTASNRESSRIGHFIEVQVSDGALYRTKIHCYFLDQSRVVKPLPMERNYHIFYQMLNGLTPEERRQLGLEQQPSFAFLQTGLSSNDINPEEAARFAEWRAGLAVLGIPFMDVSRVLAAVLLLGNVRFEPRGGSEEAYDVEIDGGDALNAVAALLGVPSRALCEGLISRTHSVRGQPVKAMSDANLCNATRNSLAKSLYCRTVATIVRRANSLKRPVGPLSGTMSSDSNESVHHEVASHHASTVGTAGSKKSAKSMALLNHAVRATTDGFIGILDMFGFEDSKPSQLEQLSINLCAETMQHFYNTHIFKSSIESCREEGITLDVTVDYVDNVPVIDLISSLRTGLLSMLDVECSVRGFPETYVQKVKVQHKDNKKLFEPKHCDSSRTFGIHHFAGPVVYDTTDFLDTNRDVIPDDLLCVFHRESCNFGFATHLFGNEIKTLLQLQGGGGGELKSRGVSFRISPTSHPELLNGDEPVSTLTQDFHTRLDNLLRTLVHAKPHFIRCLRPNENESLAEFNRMLVIQQIRSLQILETVNLMSGGFPHRMRFKAFNARYRSLAERGRRRLFRSEEKAVDDCETILDCYSRALRRAPPDSLPRNTAWAHGRKHVFLSEGARQQLERMRERRRHWAAGVVQRRWRRWRTERASGLATAQTAGAGVVPQRLAQRPRPQPIMGTPPPDLMQTDRCDFSVIQQTCALFGLDLERPPPVPPSRPYCVVGNKKITYPQTRVMRKSFPENANSEVALLKGETVVVIGVSSKRGHLVVEKRNHTLHVPFQFLEMRQPLNGIGL